MATDDSREDAHMLALHNAAAITPSGLVPAASVLVDKTGNISYVGPQAGCPPHDGVSLDLNGMALTPGFIDIHTHGGHGIAFGTPGRQAEDLTEYSQRVARSGVTGFLCSLAAPDRPNLVAVVAECALALEQGLPGAECVGIHLEGPFLSPERKGAFSRTWLRDASVEEAAELMRAARGWIRLVTVAPELPGANGVAALFRAAGVTVALGHSNAAYEVASAALRSDWSHVTHMYNAQSHFTHRQPGVVGAVLNSDGVTAELIADGVHLHEGAIRLARRCLGMERLVLVTDAMAAAGLADGEYDLVGESVTVSQGVARLKDGTLAGSTTTMDCCVRNWISATGCSLEESLRLASSNPARAIGLPGVGEITHGKLANLTALDPRLRVKLVVVGGKVVYQDGIE